MLSSQHSINNNEADDNVAVNGVGKNSPTLIQKSNAKANVFFVMVAVFWPSSDSSGGQSTGQWRTVCMSSSSTTA